VWAYARTIPEDLLASELDDCEDMNIPMGINSGGIFLRVRIR
jgi:hypothetical protein